MEAEPAEETDDRLRAGITYALLAYGTWGVAPVYWKQVASVPPFEVLACRILSSVAVAGVLLSAGRLWRELRGIAGVRSVVVTLVASALLIGTNWFVFLWAVAADRIVDTSLGYFLTPLLNVVLGVVVLGERLRAWQAVAVALAALGVARLALELGGLPWVSLTLAGSFAGYGLLRKLAPVSSLVGFAAETSLLAPLAAAYLVRLELSGGGAAGPLADLPTDTLAWLVGAGVITAGPLVWFASAARRLPLSMLGLFQYIAPSVSLVIATAIYGEPFQRSQAEAFTCIWAALAIYTWDLRRAARPRWSSTR